MNKLNSTLNKRHNKIDHNQLIMGIQEILEDQIFILNEINNKDNKVHILNENLI